MKVKHQLLNFVRWDLFCLFFLKDTSCQYFSLSVNLDVDLVRSLPYNVQTNRMLKIAEWAASSWVLLSEDCDDEVH